MRLLLALSALMASATAAQAQDVPQVIAPLRVESDGNGVNLVSGKTAIAPPMLSVPGGSNLRFDRIQNAAPYISGRVPYSNPGEQYPTGDYSIVTGNGSSDSFHCADVQDCTSIKGSGSTLVVSPTVGGTFKYRQAGSGAIYTFNVKHVHTMAQGSLGSPGAPGTVFYYLGHVAYPNGETISYSYNSYYDPVLARTFYRPATITSNLGYFISISYQGDTFGTNEWGTVGQATIYASAAPTVPLGRLTYGAGASTIVDHGDRAANDPAGRTYTCSGCSNQLGVDLETYAGSMQLPGESSATKQVAMHSGAPIVGSVVRDGVTWTYAYGNLRPGDQPFSHFYDNLTVTGPNGYSQVYTVGLVGPIASRRSVISASRDSIERTTSYGYDEYYRPSRATSPEGNEVRVGYDNYGNIIWKTTKAKGGLGPDINESASFPTDSCFNAGTPILCYRPTWSRDGLGRQTDFAYNALGQLTLQVDPADNAGVRKRTEISYATSSSGLSRRTLVLICADAATCATNPVSRTEYDYWGETFLPSAERRKDVAASVTLETTYTYDNAGRQTSVDGPLPGTADASYARYDVYGRKTWEVGPLANGVRPAKRFTYRDSDDKPVASETGTVPDSNSTTLSNITRTDLSYDNRRNAVREAVSVGGTGHSLVQRSFDDRGRLDCEAKRMNPAVFASLSAGACDLGPQGTGANDFGPDRITHNVYDAAAQLLVIQRAYRITQANGFPVNLQQNYATYEYTPNGKQKAVVDANGNRAELTWDAYDRQRRWIFPSTTTLGVANQTDYEEYTYDAVGNRTALRKRDGVTIVYQYDALNRVVVKTAPASASGAPGYSVHNGYDVRGLQTYARFGSATGPGITNAYDGFGRQLTSTTNMDGTNRTRIFQYDAASNRIGDGGGTVYDYDALGRMTKIKASDGTEWASFTYDNLGRRELLTLGTSATRSSVDYDHDTADRLERITRDLNGTSADQVLTFSYNPASQVVTRTNTNDAYASNTALNVSRDYARNGLNQYVTTTSNGSQSASFDYDANGNLKTDGSTTYVYDAENRLVSASGAKTATLAYDPLGRLWQTSGGSAGTTRFVYEDDKLVAEYDGAGVLKRAYTHGPGVDEPIIWWEIGASNQRRYNHSDHQGSIVSIADLNGNVIAVNAYDSWGIPNATNLGRFQYTGQTWVAELGMYYYKARFYSPTLGRFMQTDPAGYDDQVNLYAYVGNDPVGLVDSTGQRSEVAGGQIRIIPYDRSHPSVTIPIGQTGAKGVTGREVNFHHYNISTSSHRRSIQVVGEAIRQTPTPGPNNSGARESGQLNNAGAIPLNGSVNMVQSFLAPSPDPTRYTDIVVNYTTPGHGLKEGFIMRYGERGSDGNVTIRTYGEGNAWEQSRVIPVVKDIWPVRGEQLWKGLDRKVLQDAQK